MSNLEDIQAKVVAHTISIQQDYIQNEPVSKVLNSILKAIILITKSDYGFIMRVTNTHFIPIATSGIQCNIQSIDANLTLSSNFDLFMKKEEAIGNDQIVKFIRVSEDDIIGLISSNKLYKVPEYENVFKPLIIVCKASLEKYNVEKEIEIEKESIISYIGHELRSPLTDMRGSIIILKNSSTNKIHDEYLKYIKIIEQSNSKFVSIVNDTIDYSKLMIDKIKLTMKPVILQNTIDSVLQILRNQLQQKHITHKYIIKRDVPTTITMDGTRFQQILINILSSIISILHDNDHITITISLLDYLTISIQVNSKNDQVFENLSQRMESRKTEKIYAGIDLGLKISKKLIDLFNGSMIVGIDPLVTITLKVTSSNISINLKQIFKDRECMILSGSTKIRMALYIRLRGMDINCYSFSSIEETSFALTQADKFILFTDTDIDYKEKEGIIVKTTDWNVEDIKNTNLIVDCLNKKFIINKSDIRILVVDDNDTNRHIITKFLELTGWTNYDEVNDGSLALKELARSKYHIVLMDMNMPTDGKTTTMKIHELYGDDHLPYLIAITCNDDYIEFYDRYMKDYIIKPIQDEVILDNVLKKYAWSH